MGLDVCSDFGIAFTEEIGKKFSLDKQNGTIKIGRKKYEVRELDEWGEMVYVIFLVHQKPLIANGDSSVRSEYTEKDILQFLEKMKPLLEAGGILSSISLFG